MDLIKLGLPIVGQVLIVSVGGMIVQSAVNKVGVIFLAGYTATNKLYGILGIAATSFGFAIVSYAGQNLGAKHFDRIRKGTRVAVTIAFATSVIIGALMILFGKLFLNAFIEGTPTQTNQVMDIAYFYLVITCIFLPTIYFLHVVRSAIQGMGNTFLPMISGIVEFAMRILTVLLLPLWLGDHGIFFADIVAWIGADIFLWASYQATLKAVSRNASQDA